MSAKTNVKTTIMSIKLNHVVFSIQVKYWSTSIKYYFEKMFYE